MKLNRHYLFDMTLVVFRAGQLRHLKIKYISEPIHLNTETNYGLPMAPKLTLQE